MSENGPSYGSLTFAELNEMISKWRSIMTPIPHEIRITREQLERIVADTPLDPPVNPADIKPPYWLLGIPVTIVDRIEDTTLYQEQQIRAAEANWRKA